MARKNTKVRRDVARAIARDAAGRAGAATMTARERRAIIREGRGQFNTRLSGTSCGCPPGWRKRKSKCVKKGRRPIARCR